VAETACPRGAKHRGPWATLDEHTKDLLLGRLDWSGDDPAERQRLIERGVDYAAEAAGE
jgi:hypothetical protein